MRLLAISQNLHPSALKKFRTLSKIKNTVAKFRTLVILRTLLRHTASKMHLTAI